MSVRRYQRWEHTSAACIRRRLLCAIADGGWFSPETRQGLVQLEQRGLVEINRKRRPMRVRIIYPEQAWLEALDLWADQLMRGELRLS